jgi:hypothetical protein
MKLRRIPETHVLLLAATVDPGDAAPVLACAPAPPQNKAVEIADESAIILWDSTSKTQHFIRRAAFETNAADFGFLVPTPTKPEVEAVDNEAFAELGRITAPAVVEKTRSSGGGGCSIGCGKAADPKSSAGAAAPSVQVLEEKDVAGYRAAVLKADEAGVLGRWLQDNGYEFSPALEEWVKPYVTAGWKITAFKIAKSTPDTSGVRSKAVRMSFQTDRPFFPYREPAGQAALDKNGKKTGRLLRVFFLSNERVMGKFGGSGGS